MQGYVGVYLWQVGGQDVLVGMLGLVGVCGEVVLVGLQCCCVEVVVCVDDGQQCQVDVDVLGCFGQGLGYVQFVVEVLVVVGWVVQVMEFVDLGVVVVQQFGVELVGYGVQLLG